MRFFKWTTITIAVMLMTISLASCSEDYSSPFKGLTINNVTMDWSAEQYNITLQEEVTSSCYASTDADWCHIKASGKVIIISVDTNTTYSDRQTKVTFSDTGDNTTVIVDVNQKQNNAIFAAEDKIEAPEEGGEVEINVKSNVDYDVVIPQEVDWLSVTSTRALVDSKVRLTAMPNESGATRQAIVTLVNTETGNRDETLIYQIFTPFVELNDSLINADEPGGTFELRFDANIDVNLSTTADWITISEKKMIEKKKFSIDITLTKNKSQDERDAIIQLSGGDYGIEKTIAVHQSFSPRLSIVNKDFDLDELEQTITIELTTNLKLDVATEARFIELGNLEEIEEYKYRLKAKVASSDERIRRARITFTPQYEKWHDKAAEVSIIQKKYVLITDTTNVLLIGETHNIEYENITDMNVTWQSSNPSIATIDDTGKVTVIGKGDVVFTATTSDGKHSASKKITCAHISDFLDYEFSVISGEVTTPEGKITGYHMVCELKNNSSRTITVNQCEMFANNTYIGTQLINEVVKAGQSCYATLKSTRAFSGNFKFDWQYFLGKGTPIGEIGILSAYK